MNIRREIDNAERKRDKEPAKKAEKQAIFSLAWGRTVLFLTTGLRLTKENKAFSY
ncbi:mCG146906, partial [Mus musculus]